MTSKAPSAAQPVSEVSPPSTTTSNTISLGQRTQQAAGLGKVPLRAVTDRVVVVASANTVPRKRVSPGATRYDSQLPILSLDQLAGLIHRPRTRRPPLVERKHTRPVARQVRRRRIRSALARLASAQCAASCARRGSFQPGRTKWHV